MFDKEKVAIYIDGSNFYHYLKDKEISFPKGVKFDFKAFVDFLVNDRNCISKRYYTGVFRNVDNSIKSQELVRGQQKFLSEIENDGFVIKRGRIMYDSGKTREKGTDVKIAIDLIIGAIDNIYDTAILVSSDTDLVPAIQYIRYKKKKLEYVGFSHAPSFGIQKYANFSRLLLPLDIEKFKGR
ncbi:MAG: NYN domain-containing protein [bacterium]|nr:NYN domain-containing protein [bacterium]